MDNKAFVGFIKSLYPKENPVPLHAPRFLGNEKKYLCECIDSTFVSYVGQFVSLFEKMVAERCGSRYAIAIVNGTEALHTALLLAGVRPMDLVVTQALTFVATCNAISYCGAEPVFVDVHRRTMGMDPACLEEFLARESYRDDEGACKEKSTGRRISACVPMHTFGHPTNIEQIVRICGKFGIAVIEDSAEAIGSLYRGRHTGTFGIAGILSFNGNKPVTTGGGGMIITDDESLSAEIRHMVTTAKAAHPWEYVHDRIGFNYRMPNVNAAVGCAQMERLDETLRNKRETAKLYAEFCDANGIEFFSEPPECRSNYWLNTIITTGVEEKNTFLHYCAANGVQARPAWRLMTQLPMYSGCRSGKLDTSRWLADRIVNIPSSVRT